MPAEDEYQGRYLAHQRRKAAVLAQILAERHSGRRFADRPVGDGDLEPLLDAAARAPSSCARRGVAARVVRGRDATALLGGLLVGGVGWIHRAPAVVLLVADPVAYKAGDEVRFMPYLDAGVMAQDLMLAAAAAGMASCFVNPAVREPNRDFFTARFCAGGLFCGAVAVGWPWEES
ncbi:nitroreductase family protein [Mangrovihabitans endophyticus]|uniref:Nitroreductase domain-containing protein n=1 Tax=Mangrovihabitans endophyticus TaxID=1751298 RepID=A0A8J3C025_9ACTN|nr:nitroreductase family protein [Mangrovihabitans endophyticus]GGK89260.1 hypothetical protein GCM10012284_24040 [Mangrovihabitans endophyticus]